MSDKSGQNSISVDARARARVSEAVVRRRRQRIQVLLCQLLCFALIIAIWQWQTATGAVSAFLYGSPSGIATALVAAVRNGSLWTDLTTTALETLAGFALGNVIGTTLGLLLWYSKFISRVLQPFILALGSIPIIALAPITIIWFGTGFASKVAMSTLSVLVVSIIIAYKGALGVDPDQINLMLSLRARRSQVFRLLVVPASMTDIFAGLKLTVGFALVGAIVGEFMSSTQGLGHQIFKSGSLYAISAVFAELAVTVVLALILSSVVTHVERMLLPWRHDLS
ncbi:ABC transporter permease [Lichenicola cladoniae]|uniref:ABC transporter permease n=1 Tax=Lichenicola cladoniae TaxID=1484109 RepID=A0A6M8HMM9_9PROT|nr:ABC transporter permease [Lichenicola cladoniae]NPD67054.1 ABC transporter permease [Acetobacteraceae bacterium]QKE89595.1 ABC transporter permease [Lichenicola cladoniae]